MVQASERRLVTEAALNDVTSGQDGRLALLENAAGFTAPPLGFEDSVVKALVANPDSDTNKEMGGRFVRKGELVVNVQDYGAKGDWTAGTGTGTDNLGAFNAAYSALVAAGGGKLYIPVGQYRFSDEWNVYRKNSPRVNLVVEGADQLTTVLVSDFYGAGKSLVKCVDSAGITRSSPTSFRNLQFASVDRNGAVPVYLDIAGHGESRLDGVRFGPSNNSHLRLGAIQNVRYRDIVSFYGGRHYNYKATNGITFTTAADGSLTSSADVFTAGDVGKVFNVYPSNESLRAKYTITAVTGPRAATIAGTTLYATTSAPGGFEAAEASMTAGSQTLTADAACFTAADVGRVIYVRGARQGSWGAGNLRAKIASYTNPTTVVLDKAADIAVTSAPFTTPAVDLYEVTSMGTNDGGSNDAKIDWLHIENYAGVGLCATPNIFIHIDKMKIHGEHDPTDTWASTAAAWLDDFGGTINGELDGAATGDTRIHVSDMNDLLTFEWLATRRVRNETIFKAETMTEVNGMVEVKSFVSYTATPTGDPYEMVSDPNTAPRIAFTGLVNMLGDTQTGPRIYVGRDSYFLPNGQFVRGPSTSSGFDQILSGQNGSRTMYEDYATKKFSVGNTAGGGTSFTITDETLSLVRLLIASTGAVLPGADNTQTLGASGTRWADVVATKFTMGATGITHTTGTGTPEGVVTAPIGSEYINTSGSAGGIKYAKKSGTGNTGWVAIW